MRGHIRKRGARWVVVVDVGYDENGRRRQRWHSGYDTRRDAQRALTEILSRRQAGTYIVPSKLTVADFLREWLDAMRATLRPSTWTSYRMNTEAHIIPGLGSIPLQQLTASGLNAFYADLLAEGRRARDGGLSPTTVRYIHTILRRALAEAVRWNRLARNVADQADPPRQRNGAGHGMRTWSAAELRAFLKYVSEDRYHAAWLLAGTTGRRRGEILGLRWRDVDLEAGRVAVTQTLLDVRNELSFSAPKTGKGRRSVALDSTTLTDLRAHRKAQVEEKLTWGPAYHDGDLVFAREDGSAVHPARFSKWFNQHVRAAQLPRIRFHDLRHTHATLALQAGVHPKVVSERLGHSTISITLDVYSHAIPAMQEEAAEKVAAIVFAS